MVGGWLAGLGTEVTGPNDNSKVVRHGVATGSPMQTRSKAVAHDGPLGLGFLNRLGGLAQHAFWIVWAQMLGRLIRH